MDGGVSLGCGGGADGLAGGWCGDVADLGTLVLSELVAVGADLRRAGAGASCLEDVAENVVRRLYDTFRSGERRDCVLVRFYKTHPLAELDEHLRSFATGVAGQTPLPDATQCLTLVATAGDRAEWNDRRRSVSHQAVPLPSEQVIADFPMIASLLRQLGLQAGDLLEPDPGLITELDEKTFNVFYVPEALGSPHIPAQEDFVIPYAVRSVVGFGGMLPTGDLFSVIVFSRVPIAPATADMLKVLALSVKVAVLPFVGGPLLRDQATSRPQPGPTALTRSQVQALEQLLEVHERTAQEQALRLERLHAAERRRSDQLRALADASMLVNSTLSVQDVLNRLTDRAREIVGAHQAVASLTTGEDWAQAITSVSLSDSYADYRDYDAPPDGSGIYSLVCETNRPLRLTQRELESHPRWRGFGEAAAHHPPVRGWLAAPLVSRTGTNLGVVQLSDSHNGEFTAEDEAILVQLAQLASVSLENARSFTREHEVASALQRSLLPDIPHVPGLSIATRYLPAARDMGVGGDWYDAIPLPDGLIALVSGDVVGHDLRAAKTMAQLRHAVRAYALEDPSPAAVLRRLDRLLAHTAPDEFATVLYLLLDPATGRLLFTNAGHPPCLLVQDGHPPTYLDMEAFPPAGFVTPYPYEEGELHLVREATVLLYTDGVVESRSAPLTAGLDGLATLAGRGGSSPAQLLHSLEAHLTAQPLRDDVAMLAFARVPS